MTLLTTSLNAYKIGTGTDNIVLDLGAGGTWDDVRILHPCTVNQGGTVYLFYAGYDGSKWQIGVATEAVAGFTGVGFSKYGSNPILSYGGGGAWDENGVNQPFVIYDGSWKMWYAGIDASGNIQIGYATAADPTGPWTKSASNPVMTYNATWEGAKVLLPVVLKEAVVETFDTTSLISWWNMQGAVGAYFPDVFGTHPLSDQNTVGTSAGVQGNAAHFDPAAGENLRATSDATLQTGDIDYTFAGWLNADVLPSAGRYYQILNKESAANDREFRLDLDSAGALRWLVFDSSGNVVGNVTASSFGALSAGTWYFVEVWHDKDDNQVGIKVNGTANTAATSAAAGTCAAELTFAWHPVGYAEVDLFDGMLDEWLFLKRRLTTDEYTWLYNSGSGRAFTEVTFDYKMLYTGNEPASANGRIGLAFSTDGIYWTDSQSNPVFSPGAGGAWDDTSVFSPRTLVKSGSTYEMYYSGKPGAAEMSKSGYASSSDLITWTRGGNNPILEADRAWEDDGTNSPGEVENLNFLSIGADRYIFYDAYFGNPPTIGVVKVTVAAAGRSQVIWI